MLLALLGLVACGSDDTDSSTSDVVDNGNTSGGFGNPPGPGGTGSGGGELPGATSNGIPCDVDKILAENCRSCHGTQVIAGAPIKLLTRDDLFKPAFSDPSKTVYEVVQARMHDERRPMPPPPAAKLDAEAISPLDAWIAAGLPASTEQCAPAGGGGVDPGAEAGCTPDQVMAPPTPIEIGPDVQDEYYCYGFDVTPEQKRHITAFIPKIDNPAIVHHLLLFRVPESYGRTPQKCFWLGSALWSLVTGWAPGGPPIVLPEEAGYPEEGPTHFVLQVHYNNSAGLQNQKDSSGYSMCTTDQLRPNDADTLAFGGVLFTIPPRSRYELTCNYTWNQNEKIHVFNTSPHMHETGRSMKSVNLNGASGPELIHDSPNFDFNYQITYDVAKDIDWGDTVQTQCGFENTGSTDVKFGEATGEEMCFHFMMYYPKVTSPFFTWVVPSITGCSGTVLN